MKHRIEKCFCFLVAAMLFFGGLPVRAAETSRTVYVTATAELHEALKTARPGDEIIVAPGIYIGKLGGSASGHGSSFFNSDQSGTPQAPIILRSEDPLDKAVFIGERANTGNVLRITGDYWIIEDLKITGAQKGIMLDNASHCVLRGCEVYDIGMEGIHLRDNSCSNLIEDCCVTRTGIQNASYGEGIYIGSAKSAWATYGAACHDNTVRGCRIGPYVAAEHVDIKEGTLRTTIEGCIMDGTGMKGANYADSFIDVKGSGAVIRENVCYRNGNTVIADAFQVHCQLDDWGRDNLFENNTLYMDITEGYVVNASQANTSAMARDNIRCPAGRMYLGNVEDLSEKEDPVQPGGDPDVQPEPPPAPADTYDSTAVYTAGDEVVYQGRIYRARWWTQGTAPDPQDAWGVWQLVE